VPFLPSQKELFLRRISSRLFQIAVVVAIFTAVAASPAAATKVIKGKTFKDARIPSGTHDRVYDHCTFTGGGATRAVLELTNACHHITFRDCIIDSGPWNGISINDTGGNIHHIRFLRCRIRTQGRMGLECTSRPVSNETGYHNVRIIRCVFSPQGSQAISFDGGTGCKDNAVDRSVIKGAGVNRDQQYGAGVEVHGVSDFRFTNNKVYQCRGSLLNLQMHTTAGCGWVFNGNTLDASVHKQKVRMESDAQVVSADSVYGGNFRKNKIVAAAPGGGVAWFGECHRMDWRQTTWRDARGGSYMKPYQEQGSSGNLF
jgi:hypothetical protein